MSTSQIDADYSTENLPAGASGRGSTQSVGMRGRVLPCDDCRWDASQAPQIGSTGKEGAL